MIKNYLKLQGCKIEINGDKLKSAKLKLFQKQQLKKEGFDMRIKEE